MHLDNQPNLSKAEQFNMIANHIHISSDRLKLIYKGKRYTKENWQNLSLISNMTFLSIGKQNEDEADMNTKDIECIMQQMKVDRNTAIKTLKYYSTTYDQLIERINNVKYPLILVAYIDNQPVGYLTGYERYSSFYIWIAGVFPNHRRQGILVQLMNRTKQWAMKEKCNSLTIKTHNSFKSMLLFLISHDFKLIDIDKRQSVDTHRLILEKQLIILQHSSSN
ncbi:unnamed protein product [Rotaria sp. Silwood2]|nr:unnamed protein product [Rotaria sp. Silwood2]